MWGFHSRKPIRCAGAKVHELSGASQAIIEKYLAPIAFVSTREGLLNTTTTGGLLWQHPSQQDFEALDKVMIGGSSPVCDSWFVKWILELWITFWIMSLS
jgi:hypothetical protein